MTLRFEFGSLAATALLFGTTLALTPPCSAEVLWRGHFERSDFDAWRYLLHPQGIERTDASAAEGRYAARLTVRGEPDYWWNDDPRLNRVELQYRPDAVRTAEDADTYFGWSFMLPEPLSKARHEFGYWESAGSYRQVMRFNLRGRSIGFQFSTEQTPRWQAENALTPMQWHDIAMHIHWSADPERGVVSVWLDGERVIDRQGGKTLVSKDEAMFIQLGLLRETAPGKEVIYIDNARETSGVETLLSAGSGTGPQSSAR